MEKKLYLSIKETILSFKKFFYSILALLMLLYFFSGLYSVSQNQVGVLLRFGKIIDDRVMPGIHFAFPWPIDKIHKVPVKIIKKLYIEDFSPLYSDDPSITFYDYAILAPYCITGDNNIINMSCNLQYLISDPAEYLFYIKNAENALREITSNVIIRGVAGLSVDKVLTFGKRQLEDYIKREVQEILDNINCGLNISFVELKDVQPPNHVKASFNDVVNAQMDKQKIISQAETYKNEKIPEANARANKLIEEARSYYKEIVAKAEGESARFLDNLKAYSVSKKVTAKRLYIEFLKDIFSKVDEKYIISSEENMAPAKIKLLNIKE